MSSRFFTQLDPAWKYELLGFGSGTIGNYGCYLTALCQGLVNFGYELTPKSFNDLLKDNEAWTGEFRNYIDVDKLDNILPGIFVSYQKLERFTMTLLERLLNEGNIIIGKVSAVPIGGSGSHFVLITKVEGANAYIFDPWYGDEIKVATRYNKYGNILSLRVFKIKKGNPMVDTPANWILQNSDNWRGLIWFLQELKYQITGNPEETPLGKVKDVISGIRSRVTDLERQLTASQTEQQNRTEQVSRLKEELLNSQTLRKDLLSNLNKAINSAKETSGVYEGQLETKQGVINSQAKEIGSLKGEIAQLELKLKQGDHEVKEKLKLLTAIETIAKNVLEFIQKLTRKESNG